MTSRSLDPSDRKADTLTTAAMALQVLAENGRAGRAVRLQSGRGRHREDGLSIRAPDSRGAENAHDMYTDRGESDRANTSETRSTSKATLTYSKGQSRNSLRMALIGNRTTDDGLAALP